MKQYSQLYYLLLLLLIQAVSFGNQNLSIPEPCYLTWPGGPPNLHLTDGSGGSYAARNTDQRYISVQTGTYLLELDVVQAKITRFELSGDASTQDSGGAAEHKDDSNFGRIQWQSENNETLSLLADHKVKYEPEFFPVRIIESGPWFQHFAIHDLRFANPLQERTGGEFWMEIYAWPDRVRICLRTTDQHLASRFDDTALAESMEISGCAAFKRISLTDNQILDRRNVYTFAALEWSQVASSLRNCVVESDDKNVSIGNDRFEGIPHVRLGRLNPVKDSKTELGTPERLGGSSSYGMRLRNPADQPARLDLMIDLPENVSIVGHNLMLLDGNGNQTGIPIQISKNWHRKNLEEFLPYMGGWSHGRLSLILPAGYDQRCELKLIQGDFGYYNASSIAQLSLIGWGGNGFWIQSALGSWGETICLQPGRVLRRTMATDWRPFKHYSMDGREYGWTSNAGGADVFVYFDQSGAYVPFVHNKHLLASYGPCLAQMDFDEASKDRKMRVSGTWLLPQTKDFARVYLKIRCDILQDLEFNRLSFLQLGADRYNANLSSKGAVGDQHKLIREILFEEATNDEGYISESLTLTGSLPWVTLYGDEIEPGSRLGQAQRVMVIHDWKAILAGKERAHPQAAFYKHSFHNKENFSVELVPGDGIHQLKQGDFVEATIELVLMPLSREAYFGESRYVKSLLAGKLNDWETAQSLAVGHAPILKVGTSKVIDSPLPEIESNDLDKVFELTGTHSLVPLIVEGLRSPGSLKVVNELKNQSISLDQEWRLNSDGTWRAVLMLDPGLLPGEFMIRLNP